MDWIINDELGLTVSDVLGWTAACCMVIGGILRKFKKNKWNKNKALIFSLYSVCATIQADQEDTRSRWVLTACVSSPADCQHFENTFLVSSWPKSWIFSLLFFSQRFKLRELPIPADNLSLLSYLPVS